MDNQLSPNKAESHGLDGICGGLGPKSRTIQVHPVFNTGQAM